MARLRTASFTSSERLPDSRLPILQNPRSTLTRLEMLKNDSGDRAPRNTEGVMTGVRTQRTSHRVTGSSLHPPPTQHKALRELWAPEDRAWASNWTVTKRTAGIDRAHPLTPVCHHRPAPNKAPPIQGRSKSGPARCHSWQQLEEEESSLEAEIRRKEALLREKLRRTQEELHRIQREKEAGLEDSRRLRVTTKTYHDSASSMEDQGRLYLQMEDRGQELTSEWRPDHTRQPIPLPPSLTGSSHPTVTPPPDIPPSRPSLAGPMEGGGQDLFPCQLCGRRFSGQRLEKHTQVCEKTQNSRRKVFDSSRARAKGTDLEQYIHAQGRSKEPPPQVKSSSWRQKHESLLLAVCQARHVVTPGERPPALPPPQVNPHYVSCPHCDRRFSPRVAERHLPKCQSIKNKPRPPPAYRLTPTMCKPAY